MKSRLDRKKVQLRKDEAGYALIWVLVVLILAGIILVPLLLLMTAGLTSSHHHEERMVRFYSADAGIEDAAYKIQNDDENLPQNAGDTYPYQIEDVNGYQIDVTIENLWILTGLEDDSNGTTPHSELVTVGQITEFDEEEGTGTYWIEFSYDGSQGELKIDRVGAWLPEGLLVPALVEEEKHYWWTAKAGATREYSADEPRNAEAEALPFELSRVPQR